MKRTSGNIAKRGWQAGILLGLGGLLALPVSTSAASVSGPAASVIVRGDGTTSQAAVDATVAAFGGHMTRDISILDGGLAVVPAAELNALRAAPGIGAVTADGKLTLDSIGGYDPTSDVGSLYSTTQMIGAQKGWANGITGKGVGVPLIDTGVAPVQGLTGAGQVVNGPDLSFDSQSPALTYNDEYGHGTHIAGIIAGNDSYGAGSGLVSTVTSVVGANGQYAGNSNQFTGVAPDSHIVNVKVGDEHGVVDVSQVLAAIDWVVQHKNDNNVNIRVLNLSFGTDSVQAYQLDPLAFAAEVAWRNGIVVVASAGNAGSSSNGLSDPAVDP